MATHFPCTRAKLGAFIEEISEGERPSVYASTLFHEYDSEDGLLGGYFELSSQHPNETRAVPRLMVAAGAAAQPVCTGDSQRSKKKARAHLTTISHTPRDGETMKNSREVRTPGGPRDCASRART